ncbi:MAG: glycosyltransferase [Acidobacteria bacterium]|nr:MAG: glycosyltransferase [Acidobacteriota bacterium]
MSLTSIALAGYGVRTRHGASVPAAASVLHPGERLLAGTPAQLHAAAATPGRTTFVPVHYAAGGEWELLALEPRGLGPPLPPGEAGDERIDLRIRIAATTAAPEPASEGGSQPWQRLRTALWQEMAQTGSGVAAMAQLTQAPGLHAIWPALGLRNLVAMLARQGARAEALKLVEQARQAHPEYRELDYLAAKLLLAEGDPLGALAALRRATREVANPGAVYVGSGGEAGYRAHHVMAQIAERSGNQAVAIRHYLTGVLARPAYEPSVIGLLGQRAPRSSLPGLDMLLLHLGRAEPRYQTAVFTWWLLHQRWETAARALRIWTMPEEQRRAAEERLAAVHPPVQCARRAGERAGVVLQGPFLMVASSARINRYLGGALLADAALDVALEPTLPAEERQGAFPAPAGWAQGLRRLPRRLDVTIRHGWPPEFTPPGRGKLAVILPWEFGAIPRSWVEPMNRMDRIWVPSQFVGEVLARAGVEASRVEVIANGIHRELFRPEGATARPAEVRGMSFLFVGGAIARKGMDVLLAAWRQAFSARDEVTLVIKAMGAQTFYRHLSLAEEIAVASRDAKAAPILYREDTCSEAELAALYRGCDVTVLPYRGEGFGMPLAEALACGKPVIATAAGPAPEFCPREAGWWVTAREQEVPRALQPPQAMTGPFTWFEPDVDSLAAALQAAASASAAERARRGGIGSAHLHARYGWEHITAQYRQSLEALL